MRRCHSVFLLLLILGCVSTTTLAQNQLVGVWDFRVDSRQGPFSGILVFSDVAGELRGTVSPPESPDRNRPLRDLVFSAETSRLRFSFETRTFGPMAANVTVARDSLDGTITATQFGAANAFKAVRRSSKKEPPSGHQ